MGRLRRQPAANPANAAEQARVSDTAGGRLRTSTGRQCSKAPPAAGLQLSDQRVSVANSDDQGGCSAAAQHTGQHPHLSAQNLLNAELKGTSGSSPVQMPPIFCFRELRRTTGRNHSLQQGHDSPELPASGDGGSVLSTSASARASGDISVAGDRSDPGFTVTARRTAVGVGRRTVAVKQPRSAVTQSAEEPLAQGMPALIQPAVEADVTRDPSGFTLPPTQKGAHLSPCRSGMSIQFIYVNCASC